jgi:hypothetical protein
MRWVSLGGAVTPIGKSGKLAIGVEVICCARLGVANATNNKRREAIDVLEEGITGSSGREPASGETARMATGVPPKSASSMPL